MTEKRRWRPSAASIIAWLALLVALGAGSAWAAGKIGSHQIKRNAIHSRHIKNGQVKTKDLASGAVVASTVGADALTGAQIDESTLGRVPKADTANHAADSDSLGGVPASSYQQACQPGAIAGHVYVKGSATFSANYTSADPPLQDQFNCTGAATKVEVKRITTGTYYVDFPNIDPASHLVATGNVTVDSAGNQDDNDIVTYKLVFDAGLGRTVYRVETASGAGALEDREFSFSVDG